MAQQVPRFIELLSKDHRVIMLGGLAVIAHGRDRHTHDVDIWLDPLNSAESWSNVIADACRAFSEASVHRLPGWVQVIDQGITDAADETGMIRVLGLGMPLDIFRRPKEFEETGFDAVFQRATRNDDGTYLPDPLDLLQSKLDTDREKRPARHPASRKRCSSSLLRAAPHRIPCRCHRYARSVFRLAGPPRRPHQSGLRRAGSCPPAFA